MELSLPHEKLVCSTALVLQWRSKRVATNKELIRTLSHTSRIVTPGLTFWRQVIDTMKIPGSAPLCAPEKFNGEPASFLAEMEGQSCPHNKCHRHSGGIRLAHGAVVQSPAQGIGSTFNRPGCGTSVTLLQKRW